MNVKRRNDGMVELADDNEIVVAIGTFEAIKELLENPEKLFLLVAEKSTRELN
jgi:hypothetical protein